MISVNLELHGVLKCVSFQLFGPYFVLTYFITKGSTSIIISIRVFAQKLSTLFSLVSGSFVKPFESEDISYIM